MSECPRHDDGHECDVDGEHTLHRAEVDFQWITWGEVPTPATFAEKRPSQRRRSRGPSTDVAALKEVFERVVSSPETRVRHGDPDTSFDAAASIDPASLRATHLAVMALLEERGPMADFQIRDIFLSEYEERGWPMQSGSGLRTRRSELVEAGMVFDTGERAIHPDTGRKHTVWGVHEPSTSTVG